MIEISTISQRQNNYIVKHSLNQIKKSRELLRSFSQEKFYTSDRSLARSMYLNLNQIDIRGGASCERKIFLSIDPLKMPELFYTLTRTISFSHSLHYPSESLFTCREFK